MGGAAPPRVPVKVWRLVELACRVSRTGYVSAIGTAISNATSEKCILRDSKRPDNSDGKLESKNMSLGWKVKTGFKLQKINVRWSWKKMLSQAKRHRDTHRL